MKKIMILGVVFSTQGCVNLDSMPVYEDTDTVEVTILRSDEMQGSLSEVFVGWQDQYFFSLAPSEYARVNVAKGMTTFNVKANADKQSALTIDVKQNTSICLMLEVNRENIVGVNWYVPGYTLRQIPCLTEAEMDQYQLVLQ